MTPEQERWAFADKLMRLHGDEVGVHIAERINALSAEQDEDGVRFWIDISFKVVSLAGPDEGAWVQ